MVLQNLDRTQWTFAPTLAHVEAVVVAHRAVDKTWVPPAFSSTYRPGPGPVDNSKIWKEEAYEQLLVALKDGDLHAQGRFSTTRSGAGWQSDMQWTQHSGYYSAIGREQWREGRINLRFPRLTASEWEFIDIQFSRFMVRAIWPDYVPGGDVKETAEGAEYSPPYLDLMEEAIAYFHLSDANQEKKEALVEWFRAHRVEGAQISGNLARAMATLVRLPSAQKGGAKRSWAR